MMRPGSGQQKSPHVPRLRNGSAAVLWVSFPWVARIPGADDSHGPKGWKAQKPLACMGPGSEGTVDPELGCGHDAEAVLLERSWGDLLPH